MIKIFRSLGIEEYIADAGLMNHTEFMREYKGERRLERLKEIYEGQKKNYIMAKALGLIYLPAKNTAKILRKDLEIERYLLKRSNYRDKP